MATRPRRGSSAAFPAPAKLKLGRARHLPELIFRQRQAKDLRARGRARVRASPSRGEHRTEREQRRSPVADERGQRTGRLATRRRNVLARPDLVPGVETERPGGRRLGDRPPDRARRRLARAISDGRALPHAGPPCIYTRLLSALLLVDPHPAPP